MLAHHFSHQNWPASVINPLTGGATAQELHRMALLWHRHQPSPCLRCAFRSQTCSPQKPQPPIQQCLRIHPPMLTLHMLHCTIHTHVASSPPTLATWIPHARMVAPACSCMNSLPRNSLSSRSHSSSHDRFSTRSDNNSNNNIRCGDF